MRLFLSGLAAARVGLWRVAVSSCVLVPGTYVPGTSSYRTCTVMEVVTPTDALACESWL